MHIFRNWKKYANEIFSNQDSLLLSIIPIILGLTFSTSCRKLGMFYSYIPCPLLWYIIWSGEKHHCNMRKIQHSSDFPCLFVVCFCTNDLYFQAEIELLHFHVILFSVSRKSNIKKFLESPLRLNIRTPWNIKH